jgi:hypothetical protein
MIPMPIARGGFRIGWVALWCVLGLEAATAQTLSQRVAAAPDGAVRFSFAARPGATGDGDGGIRWRCENGECRHKGDHLRVACDTGPVRMTLTVRGGAVRAADVTVGAERAASGTDLGLVAVTEATRYLLALARTANSRVGHEAVLGAALADSVTIWPDLLALARDSSVARDTRRAAVFWVGQAAETAATRGLTDLADGSDADRDAQEAAVFALSQRPADEGVPALIRIAKTHRDPDLRRKAMFWLGQSDDPRALAFFEELLLGT